MLKVPQQEYIKYLREMEELNVNEIAELMNINWRTAKKYADKDNWNKVIKKIKRTSPVMEDYKEVVDTWLEEDLLIPRKQRHTAKKTFNRLVAEYNFPGAYRTVCSYVEKARINLKLEKQDRYEKLEHPEGEGQVDFYTAAVSDNSNFKDIKVLALSYPNSNAAFEVPLPAENQQCFLYGLRRLFEKSGGVPKSIWFDNLSSAVVQIEKECVRIVTEDFSRLRSHYSFESVFCNPGKGNEKGNVENKCGYTRRNFLVPIPVFNSFEELEKELDKRLIEDQDREHYEKKELIKDLWEKERQVLKKLPTEPYEAFKIESCKLNKYNEITVDKQIINVFDAKPLSNVLVKIRWNIIEILDDDYNVVGVVPRKYTNKVKEVPWLEVFKGYRKKPRSVTHSQFTRMLPPNTKNYITIEDLEKRKERINNFISYLSVYNINSIEKAISELGQNAEANEITILLHRISGHSTSYKNQLEDKDIIIPVTVQNSDMHQYDRLGMVAI
jgi:transposase